MTQAPPTFSAVPSVVVILPHNWQLHVRIFGSPEKY